MNSNKPKDSPRVYTFSESYENHNTDDYICDGDDGPWFEVVSRSAYEELAGHWADIVNAEKDKNKKLEALLDEMAEVFDFDCEHEMYQEHEGEKACYNCGNNETRIVILNKYREFKGEK
jgi:hypothetical protein